MTEPTYNYVKGQGWIPGPAFETANVDHRKGKFRIELRDPKVGEYYGCFSLFDKEFLKNGRADIHKLADYCNKTCTDWEAYTMLYRETDLKLDRYTYFTVIPNE